MSGPAVELAALTDVPPDIVAVGLPAWTTSGGPALVEGLPEALGAVALPTGLDAERCRRAGFTAKPGQSLIIAAAQGQPTVVALGVGAAAQGVVGGGGPPEADAWRRAAAALVRMAGEGGTAAMVLPGLAGPLLSALAEGAILAAYRYNDFRSDHRPRALDRLLLALEGGAHRDEDRVAALRRGIASATATSLARDLVNRPPSELTPRVFADLVAERFRGLPGISVEVWGEHRIEEERLGGLLGVSRGSAEPPRLVRVEYVPTQVSPSLHLALVGKGITFDSGGLSLKTADGMTTMKTDMSGAAAVLAATWACAVEGLPVRVTALAPISENMPGGRAIKPGDVLTARNRTTIEVLNTDAEGRLVLADALCLADEAGPDAVVDLATLTGAAVVALGSSMAALYSTGDDLEQALLEAAGRAGEQCWVLPLVEEYREHLDSEVADVKNIGRPGQAGSIVAALFLSRFAGDRPWAHLDIAGPARSSESSGYLTKGGTGFGVRTLLELLREPGPLASS